MTQSSASPPQPPPVQPPLSIPSPEAQHDALLAVLRSETARVPPREVEALVAAARARFEPAVRAILFYGSCRREVAVRDGIVDFWVVIDARSHCETGWRARLGAWLPPNVYFIESADEAGPLRAKVALFTLRELEQGAQAQESYVWGRLAQPISVVYAATAQDHAAVLAVLARSVQTFIGASLPLASGREVLTLWREGLARSYASELRPEGRARGADVVANDAGFYANLTRAARSDALVADSTDARNASVRQVDAAAVAACERAWRRRRRVGKLRSLLRVVKGIYTFDGGFDYIAWKLSRHSGREIVIPARVRRWPLLFVWGLAWKLYREGVFR